MRVLAVALLLAAAAPLQAQTPDLRRAGLPRQEANRIEAIIDDPSTHRYDGDTRIEAGETIDGNVFVHRGVLRLAGTVRGEVIVVDGDLRLEPGAEVTGDITVVGGSVMGVDDAVLAGTLTEYGEGFGLLASARRIHDGRGSWRGRWAEDGWDEDRFERNEGGAELAVRVAGNYNRIEGLPVQFGPVLRTGERFATKIEALAVWRTDRGPLTHSEPMGYFARAEQFLTGNGLVRIGGTAHSLVEPIESWSMTDLEATLASALFHEDQRDYFETDGWSAYLRFVPPNTDVNVMFEYRNERHRTAELRDPWTLFDQDQPWRLQPQAAEGRIRMGRFSAEIDQRRGRDFAYRGWFARVNVTRGIDGTLTLPAAADPAAVTEFDSDFTTGMIDLRRYARVGRHGSIGFRAIAGGSLDSKPLAPQFQHALGGAGSLPGYPLFSIDCGARALTLPNGNGAGGAFPSYGCDRFAMFQAEYRGGFDFHIGGRDDDDGSFHVRSGVDWTLFFDAGRGWALGDDPTRDDTEMFYDAGAGIILGGFGVYGAVPLTGEERGLRFFIRLGPRF